MVTSHSHTYDCCWQDSETLVSVYLWLDLAVSLVNRLRNVYFVLLNKT